MIVSSTMTGRIVVDVGSNTIKVLGLPADFPRSPAFQKTIEVRISEGMTGEPPELSSTAAARGVRAVEDLLAAARDIVGTPAKIRIVGTSALRDAANREIFCQAVLERTGEAVEILSGEDEAAAIARGITADPLVGTAPDFVLLDLGGGSLEVIVRERGLVTEAISLNLGAVRMLRQFPTTPNGVQPAGNREAIRQKVAALIAPTPIPAALANTPMLIGAGGAFTITRAIFAHRLGIDFEEHPGLLAIRDLTNFTNECNALPLARRIEIPGLPATRADILPIALDIILEVAHRAPVDAIHHSTYNLRWGIALAMGGDLSESGIVPDS